MVKIEVRSSFKALLEHFHPNTFETPEAALFKIK